MYRANQEALIQATNQGVIGIRQSEINYFLSVASALGTQAALIGGFTYSLFTQNVANPRYDYSTNAETAYYIMSAITIASSVHVVIVTMLIQILGPGLALRGPPGSMVRATEGMNAEQKDLMVAFTIMMLAFASSTMLVFWVVMDFKAAIGSSLVLFFAGMIWYRYCLRVYSRFFWKEADTKWNNTNFNDSMSTTGDWLEKYTQHVHDAGEVKNPVADPSSKNVSNQSKEKKPISVSRSLAVKANIVMEGYMVKRGAANELSLEGWTRRYFVMNLFGEIYYFKDRIEFRKNPKAPIKERPIQLFEHMVSVKKDHEIDKDDSTILSVVSGKGAAEATPKFQIELIPRSEEEEEDATYVRNWIFRCDTEEELEVWLSAMKEVCPNCLFQDISNK